MLLIFLWESAQKITVIELKLTMKMVLEEV